MAIDKDPPVDDMQAEMEEFFGKPIAVFTRAMALADGVLLDAGRVGVEAGFKVPVALTAAAWGEAVAVPAGLSATQSVEGRLWDVVKLAFWAVMGAGAAGRATDRVRFTVAVQGEEGMQTVHLLAVCGPGDEAEPVVTIGLPGDF